MEERQYLREWQECIDLMARVLNVPAGLIMKIVGDELTVHVSSNTEGNPYKVGDKEIFKNSGLYCERVIRHREKLCIPSALDDPEWDSNPDIKLGMIAYLGIPLECPNGDVFGTICILDSAENKFSGHHSDVMLQFKRLIEQGLKLIAEKRELEQAQQQIRTLHGIVPICAECKSIRDERGSWHQMEAYMTRHTEAHFSHGLCPTCLERAQAAIQAGE